MLDSYLSYICLARAVRIFAKYGRAQLHHASAALEKGLVEGVGLKPLLPKSVNPRVINIFELQSSQLDFGEPSRIQDVLQDYGAFVSVKQMGKGCTDCHSDDCQKSCCLVSSSPKLYIRISSWSYTTHNEFTALRMIFENNLSLSTTSVSAIRHQLLFVFDLYERLFSTLKTKAFFIRAERLRHHLIFYYAHTAVFYVNKLVVSGYLEPSQRIDPKMESVMSVGVDEMSWDDMLEDNYDWTSMAPEQHEAYLEKIQDYRHRVKDLVLGLLDSKPLVLPITQGSLHWLILMGISHENIHLETSAVIVSQVPRNATIATIAFLMHSKSQVPLDLIREHHQFTFPTYYSQKSYKDLPFPQDAPSNTLIRIPGGTVKIGRDHHGQDIYSWDNEFGSEVKVGLALLGNILYLLTTPGAEAVHCKPDAGQQCRVPGVCRGWRLHRGGPWLVVRGGLAIRAGPGGPRAALLGRPHALPDAA
jgi:hypothetical protein